MIECNRDFRLYSTEKSEILLIRERSNQKTNDTFYTLWYRCPQSLIGEDAVGYYEGDNGRTSIKFSYQHSGLSTIESRISLSLPSSFEKCRGCIHKFQPIPNDHQHLPMKALPEILTWADQRDSDLPCSIIEKEEVNKFEFSSFGITLFRHNKLVGFMLDYLSDDFSEIWLDDFCISKGSMADLQYDSMTLPLDNNRILTTIGGDAGEKYNRFKHILSNLEIS